MKNILEYLERTTVRIPDKIAFADEMEQLSFTQLSDLAKIGGTNLLAHGITYEPVVVFLPKQARTLAVFAAVLYAGCWYVPIDAGMPRHRIRMILDKLDPKGVICTDKTAAITVELGYGQSVIMQEDLLTGDINEAALDDIRSKMLDIDPAYIVFTSGSTGIPKGVTACHRSVIDYAEALCPVIGSAEDSVYGMQVPLFVDSCLKEILSVIRCGATAWLMPQSLFMFPLKALEFLNKHKINSICWVASALTMLSSLGAFDEGRPEYLKKICWGSEVFPVRQMHLWQKACPEAVFTNLYGPTEITGVCFWYRVDREFQENETFPIGHPFNNTGYFLLKEDGEPAKQGEIGELGIRGTGVTLGYYDDQERTDNVFKQNPLNHRWLDKVYMTGDLAYENERGEVVFVSRKDYQIKNMGHRIELGEIEACAQRLEGVGSTCCVWDPEKKKIALFYMGSAEEKTLQSYLRKELPRQMIPTRFFHMEQLPLLQNGKLDRKGMLEIYTSEK